MKKSSILDNMASELNFKPVIDHFNQRIESISNFKFEAREKYNNIENEGDLLKPLDDFYDFLSDLRNNFASRIEKKWLQQIQLKISIKYLDLIGLQFIASGKLRKKYEISPKPPMTIELNDWATIFGYISDQKRFQAVFENLRNEKQRLKDREFAQIVKKLPISLDERAIQRFRSFYEKNTGSFEEFLQEEKKRNSNAESGKIKDKESLHDKFEAAVEKKKLTELKEEQLDNFDNYQEYFNMDERELNRQKRKSQHGRKYTKSTRRK